MHFFLNETMMFFPLKLINITYTLKSARGVTIIFQKAHDLAFKKYLKNAYAITSKIGFFES